MYVCQIGPFLSILAIFILISCISFNGLYKKKMKKNLVPANFSEVKNRENAVNMERASFETISMPHGKNDNIKEGIFYKKHAKRQKTTFKVFFVTW